MNKTKRIILISLFAALSGIGAFIKIPIPYVPVTLQLFFCLLSGMILGAKSGMMSQLLYVFIGLLGVPVFTQGGGITYVLQPTFGYLLGFIVGAYVSGKIIEQYNDTTFLHSLIATITGTITVYLVGVPYFFCIFNLYMGKKKTLYWVMQTSFFPFIIKDLITAVFIAYVATKVIPALKKSKLL